jgi:PncC family amidohydrolase
VRQDLTLGTVESATGGLVAHLITNLPGSSQFFRGGIIGYSNEMKTQAVGVNAELIDIYGAVSTQVVEAMASGGRDLLGVDLCIADTGIAGPGGATKDKPIGLFYMGLASPEGVFSRRQIFHGDRMTNKYQAAESALLWLKEYLTGLVIQ